MDHYKLYWKKNKFWNKGELYKNDFLIERINNYYEVTPDFIYIYDTAGSSGGGPSRGDLIRKIYIGDSEFTFKEI